MTERIERTYVIDESGQEVQSKRVVVNKSETSRRLAYQVASFVWVMFSLLISLIGLRFFLKLIAANPANTFAGFLYALTDLFLWPFFGITGVPAAQGMVFEIPALIAILVYALIGWVIVKLVWLVLYRP